MTGPQGAELGELRRRFDDDQVARGLTAHSIVKRERVVMQFAAWLPKPIFDATANDVTAWADELDITPESKIAYASHLHKFFDFAVGAGLLEANPIPVANPQRRRTLAGLGPAEDSDDDVLLREWAEHERRRNLSPAGIIRMVATLRHVAAHVHPRGLLDASRHDIEAWLDSCQIGPATRRSYVVYIRSFYRWSVDEGLLEANPAARVASPRMRRYIPRPIAEDDLRHALEQADERMRAWLLLGAFAGLRCAEIAMLEREDVHDDRTPPVLHVVDGKGGKDRVVPAHPDVLDALRALPLPRSGYLFRHTDHPSRAIPAHLVSQKIGRHLRDCGVKATAHQLRHRFGSAVFAVGKDLRATQELLGHASPATTAIYAAWSPTDAAATVLALPSVR